MNGTHISGYLAFEPELRTTANGISVCQITVAVKRPHVKDKTDFITVVCWRERADFVCKFFRKGSRIEISGILTSRNYEDKNGNKRTAIEVVADTVEFGERANTENKDEFAQPVSSSDANDFNEEDFDGCPF